MNCLVLGGNGFIGSHLVDQLLLADHWVRVYDLGDNPFRGRISGVEYVYGELGDRESIRAALRDIDVIFHLIGTTIPKTSNQDPVFDVQSNIVGTLGLLLECIETSVHKIVFISSSGTVYGIPQSTPTNESHPTNPICSYGITKRTIEMYLGLYHHLHGLEYTVLRCSNAYGERQNPWGQQGAVAIFLRKVARGEPVVVWGDGRVTRDHIYVQDVANALVLAANTNTEPRIFNISSGVGTSLNQIIELILAVTGRTAEIRYEDARIVDVPVSIVDPTLAEKHLGWHARVGLETGIRRTWNWLQTVL